MLTCRQRVAGDTVWCLCVYVCVYVLACRQESLRNDSGSEREAVGCVFGRTTENSEIIVHYGIFSIIDRTSYRGQNYRINTIIIVHLATLLTADVVSQVSCITPCHGRNHHILWGGRAPPPPILEKYQSVPPNNRPIIL